jgi:geranyl-CoA carboxylase alpha subunit
VPGYEGEDQSEAVLTDAARAIGFPLMVKAAAGGGGRGMRLVTHAGALPEALKLARSEAENAFGSGVLILEKAIVAPRHVEVQVFADAHGNVVHLGERDCSVQRRHQKVIEEAPCPVMTEELRARMGEAAVEAARAVGYRGAGTVEFLLDAAGEFYFLEMNTRLQVEHPVTELVTGLDLVALQLAVAAGQPLGFSQDDVRLDGHAIEVRFYAEDPAQDFLPSTGSVLRWQPPAGEGVRVDDGIASGGEISPFYDSMVAKIIAHGANREEARRRLCRALEATALFGPASNRDFLLDALGQPAFVAGEATTAFIESCYGEEGFTVPAPTDTELAVAAVLQHTVAQRRALSRSVGVSPELLDWSSAADLETLRRYPLTQGDVTVRVRPLGNRRYRVVVGEAAVQIEVDDVGDHDARLRVDGEKRSALFYADGERTLRLALGARSLVLTDVSAGAADAAEASDGGTVRAPMHGLLLEMAVREGDVVTRGEKLAVLEAMKMQHAILAQVDGTVVQVAVAAQTQIAAGDLILEIEPAE